MITLLVLIYLLASTAQPNELYVDRQGIKDVETAVKALDSYIAASPETAKHSTGTYLYYYYKIRYRLQSRQQDVLWLQIACETRPKLRVLWEQTVKNRTNEVLELTRYRKKDSVDCDNKTTITLPSHECLCNTSSSFRYCQVLEARDYTVKAAEKIEKEMGVKMLCADELWEEVTVLNNNKSFDLRLWNGSQLELMAKDYADFTTNTYDLAHDIQNKYNQNPSSIENYCFYTPQLKKLLHNFRDYLLSKCICDLSSSAAFCTGFFYKQAALVLVNESDQIFSKDVEINRTFSHMRWLDWSQLANCADFVLLLNHRHSTAFDFEIMRHSDEYCATGCETHQQ